MYAWDILCGISKGTFEFPHKISHPYIERYDFYTPQGMFATKQFPEQILISWQSWEQIFVKFEKNIIFYIKNVF